MFDKHFFMNRKFWVYLCWCSETTATTTTILHNPFSDLLSPWIYYTLKMCLALTLFCVNFIHSPPSRGKRSKLLNDKNERLKQRMIKIKSRDSWSTTPFTIFCNTSSQRFFVITSFSLPHQVFFMPFRYKVNLHWTIFQFTLHCIFSSERLLLYNQFCRWMWHQKEEEEITWN